MFLTLSTPLRCGSSIIADAEIVFVFLVQFRVKAKESELKESEKELHVKFEKLKRVHAEEKRGLEERKRMFEEEVSCSTLCGQWSKCYAMQIQKSIV